MGTTVTDRTGLELTSRFRDALPELVVDWTASGSPDPNLLALNDELATELGLDPAALASDAGLAVFAGNAVPTGAHPVAMVYAGHQFGSYAPRLGDGRALLLGELTTPSGELVDLHLKGSGRTPMARGGDGKASLGPMLREYVIAEAMHALGVPTTRSLAVLTTGEQVLRDGDGTGAVLVRTAASHLRVGTFEYAARLPDPTVLRRLFDHAIERHHPTAVGAAHPELAFLESVVDAQASLVAQWMLLGFIHGVMNTDNMTISGETIDYGPCAFMDGFDPNAVFSSIDHGGRYRYGQQPPIAQWNLTRLAETLLPLHTDVDAAVEASQDLLGSFPDRYGNAWEAGLRRKLGLVDEREGDAELFSELFDALATMQADLTGAFRSLSARLDDADTTSTSPIATALDRWVGRWRERVAVEGRPVDTVRAELDAVNPIYVPRNHLVEEALAAAVDGDLAPFRRLVEVTTHPFTPQRDAQRYAEPAPDGFTDGYRTFCGT